MLITADRDKCCGAGQCALLAPDLFDQTEDDGLVMVLDPDPAPGRWPAAREAAAVCPASAISVTD